MKRARPTYYKVTNVDGSGPYATHFRYDLPNGKPGAWTPKVEMKLRACVSGYHLCDESNLIEWLGPRIHEVESQSEVVRLDGKLVTAGPVRLVRTFAHWNDKTARLFAAACAQRVLPIFEKQYPDDSRPQASIDAAVAFAYGHIDKDDLAAARDAAGDAARDAAWAAAWAAARDAEREEQTKLLLAILKHGERAIR